MNYEPLSPVQVESKIRSLVTEITRAQRALAEARDLEVDAEHDYKSAERRAILSEDCPKIRGAESVSAAERDAWVGHRCDGVEFAYKIAKAKREAAKDHLDAVNTQSTLVMALRRSVEQAYSMAGAS
jgi:hypothetical protein